MSVQFILGRSGTGKTSFCIRSIIRELTDGNPAENLILLVPAQATYQAQRAILADKKIAGYRRLRVLSFERLTFLLIGKHTAKPEISQIGAEMIIHRILRANRDKLTVFSQAAQTPGLATKLAKTVVEMHQCAHTNYDVQQLARKLKKKETHNLTALKFGDIALVFEQYLKFIGGKFVNPDIQLSDALKKVPQADFLKAAKLWVDGFASFTIQQLKLLVELLRVASESHIALCLDPTTIDVKNPDAAGLDPTGLFGSTERTFTDLVEIVKKCKLKLDEPIILNRPLRFSASQPLAHAQKNLFTPPAEPAIKAKDNIHIIAAANRRAEVEYVARQIIKLVRGRDYRFRDIAVIASDLASYQHYIEAAFNDYNIPFFIDRPKSLATHPVIELIISALQVITNGFSSNDIFTYLKNDLASIDKNDVDTLENYCLAFGIDGNDWPANSDWTFAPKDDTQFNEKMINKIRREAIAPLSRLRADLGLDKNAQSITAGEFTKAVWLFLESLDIRRKLSQWSKHDPEDRQLGHRQFYDKLVNLFDELDEIFGAELMPVGHWVSILCNAFSKLTLKLIPPTLDQVLAGSIERSRHPDLKAVFLVGATQKQFPEPLSFDSILTDEDRADAEAHDFHLRENVRQKLANRQYLAYIAFTRPAEYLCVTYPLMDDSGIPLVPSPFLDNLKSLFVDLTDRPAAKAHDIENICSEPQLADLLCDKLGKDTRITQNQSDTLCELAGSLSKDSELAETGRQVKYALSYGNKATLDKNFAKQFFTGSLTCSATRLSSFAACPYQHFARYVLDLQERKLFGFEPIDLGRFYHRVLDGLFKRLKKQNADFATASDDQLQQACTEQIAATIESDSALSNFQKHSRRNEYIINSAGDILHDCVQAYAEMARAGSFRQRASELAFGKVAQDSLRCSFTTPHDRKINLKGVIDRIDYANIDGRQVALILDYKRRPRTISWNDLYYGLDMQLAIYMLALTGAEIDDTKINYVAGAFYLPVEPAPPKRTVNDLKQLPAKFNYKAKGIFNGQFAGVLDSGPTPGRWNRFYNFFITKGRPYGHFPGSGALKPDQFAKLLQFTKSRIIELVERMSSGRIDITPYRLANKSPCSRCKYRPVCKFDWQINDYNPLTPANKENVLQEIGAGDGD
jgi:ATP-dependent helicase/nuclease subunit B